MKKEYPNYKKSGITTKTLEARLSVKEKSIVKKFEEYCLITESPNKVNDIKMNLLQFRDIIQKPLSQINLEDVRGFLSVLNQSGRRSKNGTKITVKRFLRWYYKDWSKRFDNLKDIKLANNFNEEKINEGTLLTKEELELLCRTANNYRDKAIVLCLYELGCRPEELKKLKWKDIKFRDDDLAEVTLFSGKTKTSRTILIKDSVLVLKDWKQHYKFPDMRDSDFVFPAKHRDREMSRVLLSALISRLGEKAKLNRRIFPYLFRHSRLTELHNLKLPEQTWKKFAGHKPHSRMIGVYTHISNKDLTKCLLEDIYKIKELTPEQKNKYEIEINNLKKEVEKIKKNYAGALKSNATEMTEIRRLAKIFKNLQDKKN